ncbi:MAG TPA: glycosyltransferase [Kiritimatiellia bacterium]|nr:glycosyltransferase [Kiritimatiellia bacterium]
MSESVSSIELSIVIPTMGRPILHKTLDSLLAAQGIDRAEILVCGKISDPELAERVARLCEENDRVRHFPVVFEVGDSSEKKNVGWREATSDLVAFIDDDVAVSPDWPDRMIECFADPSVGLASGPSLVPEDIPFIARLAGLTLASKAAGYVSERYLTGDAGVREVKWSRLIGCNMVYRKKVISDLGGFDPKFWPGEEMISAWLATEAGHKLVFVPHAYLYHYPRESLGRFWKQIFGYGATRIRLYRAGVEFEPSALVPGIWVASLIVLLAAWPFGSWAGPLLGLNLIAYGGVAAWITAAKVMETRRASDALMVFMVPFMHLAYGWAEWVEVFRPDRDLSMR